MKTVGMRPTRRVIHGEHVRVTSGWHDGNRANWHAEVVVESTGETIGYACSAVSEMAARRAALAEARQGEGK